MADLLFILFGFSRLDNDELKQFYLFGQIQTSQTRGQSYIDSSPNGECYRNIKHHDFHPSDSGPSTQSTFSLIYWIV